MEISKCVGGSSGRAQFYVIPHQKSHWLSLDQRHTLSYVITDKEDYLVDLFLGNT